MKEPRQDLYHVAAHLPVVLVESQDAVTNRCDSIVPREGVLVTTAKTTTFEGRIF